MDSNTCVVVDYGLGNVFSVMRAIEKIGAKATLTADPGKIAKADRVILPGVGAFGRAADRLRERGLEEPILEFTRTGRPFLGICVGMQLLMEIGTEFGEHRGFGLIGGGVHRMELAEEDGSRLRIPLIGWHPIHPPEGAPRSSWKGTLLESFEAENAFYFVHSFAANLTEGSDALAVARHGENEVIAAVCRDNVTGVQFHPERSSNQGLRFLKRFIEQ
ncbi:imidazole glycerol phosphate synthase subunit HisH [Altererythrobacter sp. MF3-039]|uniref:imidazole glycerol phosphate synthase subunit HisH n=1 Tax=Altererythrobacter sp. MF3-039 TaxID=3252901 RepID=UPI00390C4997